MIDQRAYNRELIEEFRANRASPAVPSNAGPCCYLRPSMPRPASATRRR